MNGNNRFSPDNSEKNMLEEVLQRFGQSHLLRYWDELDPEGRTRFKHQIEGIHFSLTQKLSEQIRQAAKNKTNHMEPASAILLPRNRAEQESVRKIREAGEEVIRAGKLCAFVVAGGQGTRLGFEGPKGCYPIGPVSSRSIFQWHAEKILAAERRYGSTIPWYIMTAESNDEETRQFFKSHRYFGLNPSDVMFIKQGTLPVLDVHGKLILDAKNHIFMSPNGHGGAMKALIASGAVEDMKKRGIECISYFQVDNVLIQIVDPLFIGYHDKANAQMSSKMLKKRDSGEKLGHFGLIDGKLHVIEYSDLSDEDKEARTPDGRLKYEAGSIAIHLIHPDFVIEEAASDDKMPYHIAFKKIPFLDSNGNLKHPDAPNGYKFELFIFDALKDTERSIILEVEREQEFSPVKNKEGEDSPATARRDLSNFFGGWFEASGIQVPRDEFGNVIGTIEISPVFADSKDAFIEKDLSIRFHDSICLDPA